MDKNLLKKFAIESRQDLMKKMESKIKLFYVDKTFSKQQNGDVYVLSNEKHTLNLSKEEYEKRELLIKRINELGIEQVIEEAAYTWFNRIVAIRYMEINDYLPLTKDNQSLGIRVLSSKDNTPDPEIMKFNNLTNPDLDIDFKKEKYIELKDDNEKYKYVLLLVCKKLGRVIPQVFGGITDYIDLLVPDNLLNDSGFVNKMITEVPTDNYDKVEIIGWLYQYYNQIEKDRVMSEKNPYRKNEIPYATQIFTPDWVVKYLVENSLGKYWIEHNGNNALIKKWKYYVENDKENNEESIDPINIKCIDPCMGSGHILVYLFEVLYQIYESYGYSKNIICELILKNNLFGLDIDDRAGQLSILSVLLKAREYDKNIFNKDISSIIKIQSIQESNIDNIINCISVNDELLDSLNAINIKFKNAKEFGSLIKVGNHDFSKLKKFIENDDTIFGYELNERIRPLFNQYEILSQKYNVVVTNPPYMGTNKMSNNLKTFLLKEYSDSKTDLCSAFMEIDCVSDNGYMAMINQQAWMFLGSFEKLRKKMIENKSIYSMIHLGMGTFGADFGTTAFVIGKRTNKFFKFFRMVDYKTSEDKEKSFIKSLNDNSNVYLSNNDKFKKIIGNPIAYWASDEVVKAFENNLLSDIADPKQGLATGDNEKFLRFWHEVSFENIALKCSSSDEAIRSNCKWFPCNKGGEYRKWFGNNYRVVDWFNNGENLKKYKGSVLRNVDYYFKKGLTWSSMTSSSLSMRFSDIGNIFESKGSMCYLSDEKYIYYILGLLNSKVVNNLLLILSPTLDYHEGPMGRVPVIIDDSYLSIVNELVTGNIKIAKDYWDSNEFSYEFKSISYKDENINLNENINLTIKKEEENFNLLKNNEEKLNSIFISLYGLNNELDNKIDNNDISYKVETYKELIIKLISYSIGCMFGRYSLDKEGLIYAGGEFDKNNYKTFKADTDNIIPITDEAYFADDIVARFKEFIEVVYGKETLNENLDFIADTLGKKGTETSIDTIRRYFLNDFYSDHIKMYQKKPIYWLFDSGKKNGFKALIYMHRYNENTVPKVRLDYLHRVQNTYDKLLADVNYKLTTDLSVSDKKIAQSRQADLNSKLQEIVAYDEKIAHIANQRISIDLDDGVTVNYAKFEDILAKIK